MIILYEYHTQTFSDFLFNLRSKWYLLHLGAVEKYQLPYFDFVEPDPSHEEMQKVVCIDRRRPLFPDYWHQNDVCSF